MTREEAVRQIDKMLNEVKNLLDSGLNLYAEEILSEIPKISLIDNRVVITERQYYQYQDYFFEIRERLDE